MSAVETETVTSVPQSAAAPLIVHVVRQFLPNRGGLEDVVANLAYQTIKHGYRVRVITLDSLFTSRGNKLPAHETIDGIEVVRIPWSGSQRYPIAPQVFRHLGDAAVIHVHAIDFFFDALALGRFLHGKPMIVTTHGGFFHTRKYATIKKLWFQTLTRMSARAYKRIVGCSVSDLEQFRKISPRTSILIENGVDIGKFADSASQKPRRRIITIGRFSLNKRLDHLLDVMAILKARNLEWHLDIVGSESDLKEADLRREIQARALDTTVTLTVSPDNDSIARLIRSASLFASASEYEGFGLVALEAMSAGLVPVLNGNAAYCGLAAKHPLLRLADFSDPQAAADILESAHLALPIDPAGIRLTLMQEAGRYSWQTVAGRYFSVYDSVLSD